MRTLIHNKVTLALHELAPVPAQPRARPLLLLHGLGERTPPRLPSELEGWPHAVYGLDFTGHGDSTLPMGGGYGAEVLLGDVDAALAALGPVTLLGRGLGAYVALLAAGARPQLVRGAILGDGPGLGGGGTRGTSQLTAPERTWSGTPDPFALAELAQDARPGDYAAAWARLACQQSGLERPLSVVALERSDWLEAVLRVVGGRPATLEESLARYQRVA